MTTTSANMGSPGQDFTARGGVAARLMPLLERLTGAPAPLRLRGWDAGTGGDADVPTVVLRSRTALRRLLWQPDELSLIEDAGFEIRDVHPLREHDVRTIDAWQATLEDRWDDFVAQVGETTARVWRLYLVGGSLAFEAQRPARGSRSNPRTAPEPWTVR